jgi:hypothetical protein
VNTRCKGYNENDNTTAHISADKNGFNTTTHPTNNDNKATPPNRGSNLRFGGSW